MRHDKLDKQLDLMMLLIENHNYTIDDICRRMNISRRNVYYYIDFFRDAGFIVEHSRPYYRISKDSPFFKKLDAAVHLTEDEALAIRRLLSFTATDSVQLRRIKQKLDKLYDLDIANNPLFNEHTSQNVAMLYDAIKLHQVVALKDYSSPHSNTVSTRHVEPFLFLNGNSEVRCYEIASGMNKTFKVARIGSVEPLDLLWSHESDHRRLFTDIFMFSSEQTRKVTLRMGRLAMQVLIEEYPSAAGAVEECGEGKWKATLEICSNIGIGRFILGLYEDIDVEGDDSLKDYINTKINIYKQKQQ